MFHLSSWWLNGHLFDIWSNGKTWISREEYDNVNIDFDFETLKRPNENHLKCSLKNNYQHMSISYIIKQKSISQQANEGF